MKNPFENKNIHIRIKGPTPNTKSTIFAVLGVVFFSSFASINLEVNFFRVNNNFFGDSVTVAGLLTGKDIVDQLKGKDLGSSVWTTYRVLNDEQTLTLDDMTLDDISNELGVDFKISNDSIYEIINEVLNEE